jgi:CheY-like chemotaxis protein
VYGASERFALIVTQDAEVHRALRDVVEGAGYTAGPFARTYADVEQQINTWPSVDLVVINLPRADALRAVSQARTMDPLLASPVLALTSNNDYRPLERDLEDDHAAAVRLIGIDARMMRQAIADLADRTYGGAITEAEARDYASRALSLLRDLAVSRNDVVRVQDVSGQLIAALRADVGGHGLRIAEVLSWVPAGEAQQEILEAGLRAAAEQRLAYLASASASARRFGDLLTDRQRQEVVRLARSSDAAEATAAASLLGSLNLPNDDLAPLILGDEPVDLTAR